MPAPYLDTECDNLIFNEAYEKDDADIGEYDVELQAQLFEEYSRASRHTPPRSPSRHTPPRYTPPPPRNPLYAPSTSRILQCPHCREGFEIVDRNCGIFICGATYEGQLPPHDEAFAHAAKRLGYLRVGCGKQFRIDKHGIPVPCTKM
jgi:hypothetical protein